MKKLTLLLLTLTLIAVSTGAKCPFSSSNSNTSSGPPNPGFSLKCITRLGARDRVLPQATTGAIQRRPLPPDATGTVRDFYSVVASNSGQADFKDGVAPAFWGFSAEANWDRCTNTLFFGGVNRGALNLYACEKINIGPGSGIGSTLTPDSIDLTAAPLEFTAYADGVNATYGMPTFQFVNEYGTMVAQTQATSIDTYDGTWAKGWSSSLSGLPIGQYSILMINATADGIGQQIGMSNVYLYGGSVQSPIDDPSFFVHMQYLDFLNREPDQDGWSGWTSNLTACGTDAQCMFDRRISVSEAFFHSSEFMQDKPALSDANWGTPSYNQEFVRQCFLVYLRREPDQIGYAGWMDYLNTSSNDYKGLVEGFIYSDEYRTRFDPPAPTPDPVCNPTSYEISSCDMQGGTWDYSLCRCTTY